MVGSRVEPQTSDPSSAAPRDFARVALWVVAGTAAAAILVTGNTTIYGVSQLPLFYDASLPRLVIAVLGILAALVLLAWESGRSGSLSVHPAIGLLAATAALASVSAAFAQDPGLAVLGMIDRLEGAVTWVLYALTALAAVNAVWRLRDVRTLAIVVVLATTVGAAYGLLQWAGIEWANLAVENPGFDTRRAFATFGNPNFFGGVLVLALPIAAGLALSERNERAAAAWWAAAVAIGLALFATFTRGAWLGGAAAVVALVLLARGRVALRRIDRLALGLGAVAAAGALAAGLIADGEISLLARLSVGASAGGSLSERLLTWQAAAQAALAKPLLGYGPDAFVSAFRLHRPAAVAEVFGPAYLNSNAHDWPLQAAATIGVPAALLFSAGIVWALVSAWRVSRRAGRGDAVLVSVVAGCLGFAVHMLFNVAVLGATVPFFVLLGGALSPAARDVRVPAAALRGAAVALGALLVGAAVLFVPVVSADQSYLASRLAIRGWALGDASALARAAADRDPTRIRYSRGAAEALAGRYYEAVPVVGAGARELFDAADAAFSAHNLEYGADYPGAAWHAALLASGSEAFEDRVLARRAREVAARAAALDVAGTQVEALADGKTDRGARASALSVPGVP